MPPAAALPPTPTLHDVQPKWVPSRGAPISCHAPKGARMRKRNPIAKKPTRGDALAQRGKAGTRPQPKGQADRPGQGAPTSRRRLGRRLQSPPGRRTCQPGTGPRAGRPSLMAGRHGPGRRAGGIQLHASQMSAGRGQKVFRLVKIIERRTSGTLHFFPAPSAPEASQRAPS